jgi:hypothetical protein
MAPPTFYGTSFRRLELLAVTDVQTIIDSIKDEVLSQLPVASRWTNLGLDKLRTPPDTSGRFMSVQLTRTAMTRLGFHVRNQIDDTILNGELDIGTSVVRIWSGDYHLFVERQEGGGFEKAHAFMTDPRPEALNAHEFYVMAKTERNSLGAVFPNAGVSRTWFAKDATGVVSERERLATFLANECKTFSGEEAATGALFAALASDSTNRRAGYAFQLALVDVANSQSLSIGLPVDAGVVGTFEVLGGLDVTNGQRLAIRRG